MPDYGNDIEKYLKGELTPAERHVLEKKALNDPFLADALEGAEQITSTDFVKDVAQLKEQIAGKKVVSLWMWTARIAAGLAFILVSTFILWNLMETEPPQDLAMEKNEKVETPPAAKDSSAPSTGTLSSPPSEQPTAGPSISEKDAAKQKASPRKTETKPNGAGETDAKPVIKTEPVMTEAIASAEAEKEVEEKVDALKVTEPITQAESRKEAESSRAKADDEQQRSMLSKSAGADKKKVAAAAPAAVDKSGFPYSYSTNQRVVRGQVTSADDGSAIPGANVIIKGTTLGTATDANGNYEIVVPEDSKTLTYSFIGQLTKDLNINDSQTMDVQLQADQTQLSEIVVTAQGIQREAKSLGYSVSTSEDKVPTIDLAHPEIGSRAYKQFLENNIHYPEQAKTNKIEGRVTVEFTIEPNGSLTNFTVIRGIGSGCDEELIRLIKEGPKWIPTKKDNVPVQDKAKVRLKFDLPK